jgi:transcriptional regulator with XRE-family HTH domain
VDFETIGKRLAWARDVADMGQAELARLAGLKSTRHVGLIEEGQRDNVTSSTATGLCRVLGMSLDWFLTGKEPPPTPEQICAAVARARELGPAVEQEPAA